MLRFDCCAMDFLSGNTNTLSGIGILAMAAHILLFQRHDNYCRAFLSSCYFRLFLMTFSCFVCKWCVRFFSLLVISCAIIKIFQRKANWNVNRSRLKIKARNTERRQPTEKNLKTDRFEKTEAFMLGQRRGHQPSYDKVMLTAKLQIFT